MDINFRDNENIINVVSSEVSSWFNTHLYGFPPDKELIEILKSKKFITVYSLYGEFSQPNLDDDSMPDEFHEGLIKIYSSLVEFENDTSIKKSGKTLKKEIFYCDEKAVNLYKNDSTLKLEWLFPKNLTIKQWGFK